MPEHSWGIGPIRGGIRRGGVIIVIFCGGRRFVSSLVRQMGPSDRAVSICRQAFGAAVTNGPFTILDERCAEQSGFPDKEPSPGSERAH